MSCWGVVPESFPCALPSCAAELGDPHVPTLCSPARGAPHLLLPISGVGLGHPQRGRTPAMPSPLSASQTEKPPQSLVVNKSHSPTRQPRKAPGAHTASRADANHAAFCSTQHCPSPSPLDGGLQHSPTPPSCCLLPQAWLCLCNSAGPRGMQRAGAAPWGTRSSAWTPGATPQPHLWGLERSRSSQGTAKPI